MSRPSSRKSGKKDGRKGSAKTPKKQILELTEQNHLLSEQMDVLKLENQDVKLKLHAMTKKLVASYSQKELWKVFNITDKTNLDNLTVDVLMDLVDKLIVKKQVFEGSVEARVQQLEARVTDMGFQNIKLTKRNMAYENGLEDMVEMHDLEQIQDKIYNLRILAGQAFHSLQYNDPDDQKSTVTYIDGQIDVAATHEVQDAHKLNLMKNAVKHPAETHISQMDTDMRLYIMQELSKEKVSGGDWRLFSERVGIPREKVDYWRSLGLVCPMGRVFAEWGTDTSATVRLLHRHLTSPALKYIFLGKRIADYYDVD